AGVPAVPAGVPALPVEVPAVPELLLVPPVPWLFGLVGVPVELPPVTRPLLPLLLPLLGPLPSSSGAGLLACATQAPSESSETPRTSSLVGVRAFMVPDLSGCGFRPGSTCRSCRPWLPQVCILPTWNR